MFADSVIFETFRGVQRLATVKWQEFGLPSTGFGPSSANLARDPRNLGRICSISWQPCPNPSTFVDFKPNSADIGPTPVKFIEASSNRRKFRPQRGQLPSDSRQTWPPPSTTRSNSSLVWFESAPHLAGQHMDIIQMLCDSSWPHWLATTLGAIPRLAGILRNRPARAQKSLRSRSGEQFSTARSGKQSSKQFGNMSEHPSKGLREWSGKEYPSILSSPPCCTRRCCPALIGPFTKVRSRSKPGSICTTEAQRCSGRISAGLEEPGEPPGPG